MLEDGLSYPLAGDNAIERLLIGGLLGFGSFLIVPMFALFGYLVWVLDGAAHEEPEPPAFDDWGDMIVDGLKATVVAFFYGIVPIVLLAVSFAVIGSGALLGSDTATGLLGGLGLIGILVSVLAMLLLYYLVPAALAGMAVEGDIGGAFDVDTLTDALFSVDYLVAWLIPVVLGLFLNVVTLILVLTVFGLLLVPFLNFYAQVAIFFMFGRAFGEAIGVGDGDVDQPEEGAVPA